MWFKVFADGSEYDILYADTLEQAIAQAKWKHGEGAVWTARPY